MSTLCSASSTKRGAGTGTAGPIMSVRWMPFNMRGRLLGARGRHALRQRDANHVAGSRGEIVRTQRAVGIAHAPELFRIANVAGGQDIEPLPFDDEVLVEESEVLR